MANNKTPISLLQEITVQEKGAMPVYQEVVSDLPHYPFKCMVRVKTITAYGHGHTKKEAKQNCAQDALLQIGVGLSSAYQNNNYITKPVSPPSNINYIGKLNEFASGNQLRYPMYCDQLPQNGLFTVVCHFQEMKTQGHGTTKKDAKQEASKIMLERLEKEDVKYKLCQKVIDNNLNTDIIDKVLVKYEKLSVINEKPTVPICPDYELPKFEDDGEKITLEEFVEKLRSLGHPCQIEVFQRKPYIVLIRMKNNSCVVMGHGKTEEEAKEDLLNYSRMIFDCGFSFKNYF